MNESDLPDVVSTNIVIAALGPLMTFTTLILRLHIHRGTQQIYDSTPEALSDEAELHTLDGRFRFSEHLIGHSN